MELDELDLRLLQALVDDPRRSFRSLAKDLDSSTPTVGNRIRRMESLGIIVGYRTEVDPAYLPGTPFLVSARVIKAQDGMPHHPEAEQTFRLPGGRVVFVVRAQGAGLGAVDQWCREHGLQDVDITPIVASSFGQPPIAALERIHLRCHHCRKAIQGEAVTARLAGRTHAFCCPLCKEAFAKRHADLA